MKSERDVPNFFAGAHIDRRSAERAREDWHLEALADESTRFLIGRGTTHLIGSAEASGIAFLNRTHPLVQAAHPQQLVLLGWFRGARCVLLEIGDEDPALLSATASFEELRPLASRLSEEDAALLAYARALAIWRARTRHCGVCGSPTVPRQAGHVMQCSNTSCGEEFFPRLDPAIIVLVSDGERALLGRQANWAPGRYSTLAGFVEPGESLEDAVIREVLEETGVQAYAPSYRSSQPWPFPSSLMLGFEARAEPGSVIRLNGELEDARWFSPTELQSGTAMPPSHSISYRLITGWLKGRR